MALTTITNPMVAVNAIQGTLIADNAITAVHIATNAVSGTLIADNAVTAVHIAQNTITVTQIADDAIEAAKIADGVITTNHLNKAMISSQTEVTAVGGDYVLIGDTSDSNNLKKALVSDFGNDLDAAVTINESGASVDFRVESNTNANMLFVDGSADKIGIGTSSPSTLLHLGGTAPGDSIIRQDSTSSGTNWEIGERAAGKWSIFEDDGDSIVATFTSTGNLAINGADNNIDRTFTIGTGAAKTSTTTVYPFAIQTNESSNAGRFSAHYIGGAAASDRKIYFQMEEEGVANNGHIIFNPYGGKVGIGSTSVPDEALHVNGNVMLNNANEIRSKDTGGSIRTIVRVNSSNELEYGWSGAGNVKFMGGGSYTERMRINSSNGTVNIGNINFNGTSSNSIISAGNANIKISTLEFTGGAGNLDFDIYLAITGGIQRVFQVEAAGSGDTYTNDGSVSSLSDQRIKTDINNLADGLDIVKQLRPVTFKYNDTTEDEEGKHDFGYQSDKIRYGFIAQEVEEVAPHYVETSTRKINNEEVDDFKSLSTTRMIPMLVKAIQELSAEVEKLKG